MEDIDHVCNVELKHLSKSVLADMFQMSLEVIFETFPLEN